MEKNKSTEKNIAAFCATMIIGAIIMVCLLNVFGAYDTNELSTQPEPKKTEKVHGDSITVTCPKCGMFIER